jgi:hypothetical protein
MYDAVYDCFVEAGAAELMEEEMMYDDQGNITDNVTKMYGRPTKYRMKHPENVVFVDETGCNTNQKDDGHIGGEQFVLSRKGDDLGVVGATTDMHFTVLCFTSGIGDPILCAVILKSSKDIKDIPISWKLGIDIRKDIQTGRTNYETFEMNYGEDKSFVGGPKCLYNGNVLPCFVGCSPNASITSEILAGMIELIDKKEVFDRSTGNLPVLLLDGHQSRMKLPFLEYVNDPEHKWMVCLGVPYGTHLWQVADAPELNGSFKINMWKAKRAYLKYRTLENQKFVITDVIPLVNMAWHGSFTRADRARKAILQRGWGPLNYCLLDHPKLIRLDSSDIRPTATVSSDGMSTIPSSNNSMDITLSIDNLNVEGPVVSSMLDLLVDNKAKSEGHKEKNKEKKRKIEETNNKLALLAEVSNVTSGQLACQNIYTLTCEEVISKVRTTEVNKQQKRSEIDVKKAAQQAKESQQFRQAYQKYANNQRLAASDLRALIRKTKHHRDDSPVRSKMLELQEQWDRRKHRLDDFLLNNANELHEPPAVLPNPVLELPGTNLPVPSGIFVEEHVEQPIGSADNILVNR